MRKHSPKTHIHAAIITICGLFLLMCIYLASTYKNVLDFLLAVWCVVFLVMIGFCIAAVLTVLLYDYFNHN